MIPLHEMLGTGKSIETESGCLWLVEEELEENEVIANGYHVFFGGDKNILKLMVVMFA